MREATATPTSPATAPKDTTTATATAPAKPTVATMAVTELKRVLPHPIESLTVDGQKGTVAALGQQPWISDPWRSLPIPKALRPSNLERDQARIFFGRDNQPRIMGSRIGPAGPRQLYLRYRRGRWRWGRRELGAFASGPDAALYGVLGWRDPEVVCKVGLFCLIKSRRGWSKAKLPLAPPAVAQRIDLGSDAAYALLKQRLLVLQATRWKSVGGEAPWGGSPAAAWVEGKSAWVSVPDDDALYRYEGASWKRNESPVRSPRGLWSDDPNSVWVVGRDGAAYFDGKLWRRIEGLQGPLAEVVGHGETVWLGGSSGVFRVRR